MNGATWTANRPSFPLVQPEKVLSLPLDLRLGRDYTYRLDGVETVAGRPAYVVHFDPIGTGRALFRGTVWIDRQEFVRLKVQAIETHLTGVVVSNVKPRLVRRPGQDIDGKSIWLLERQTSAWQMFCTVARPDAADRAQAATVMSALETAGFRGRTDGGPRRQPDVCPPDTEQERAIWSSAARREWSAIS